MKKFLILFAAFTLSLALTGCNGDSSELPELPDEIGMTEIDDYLGRPDVQYVDLRNFDDKMASGYIAGFEFIPFFDYLEATDILVRTDGDWTFAAEDVVSQVALEALFDDDKAIFLMCGSGTRAGFVKAALEEIGYDDVYNVGGISTYTAETDKLNYVAGDDTYNVEVQLPLPATVNMENIDMYLGRSDVQYVDLRNFDDKMASGYIAGFEFIPFFDYLEHENILVRTDGWNFEAAAIVNEGALTALFDSSKTIFLMCGSGTRAGFVKSALDSLGYTVYNVGGTSQYLADTDAVNFVLGDEDYAISVEMAGPYTPGVYYGFDPIGLYETTIVIGPRGGIMAVYFDAINGDSTKQTLGYDYGMTARSDYEWFEHADMLADFIVANQGWDGISFIETDLTGLNAMTVGHHFLDIDPENSPDAVAAVSIGVEGFVLSWNDAIMKATEEGTLGLVPGVDQTAADWAMAHYPAYPYKDGVYFGADEAHGYTVKVTIEGGFIVDVFFDAIVVDAETGEMTTKQVLGFGYGMSVFGSAELEWFEQANLLGNAIVEQQRWNPEWDTFEDGSHFRFVADDEEVVADGIAGVSIGMEGFEAAWLEAIAQAMPEWNAYGIGLMFGPNGGELFTYTNTPAEWWNNNAQLPIADFDETATGIEFTFIATEGVSFLFKVEGNGAFVETATTGTGVEQTFLLDISSLTPEQIAGLNLFVLFCNQAGATGTLEMLGWEYVYPAA